MPGVSTYSAVQICGATSQIGIDGGFNQRAYAFGNPISHSDPSGNWVWVPAAGLIGAAVNVGLSAWANGGIGNMTNSQIAAAAASGFVSGSLGALGGPLGGTIARSLGQASNGWVAAIVAGGASAAAGAAGQAAANCLDPANASSLANAALWGGVGGAGAKFLVPTKNMNTLSQAANFGPSTIPGLFRSSNAWMNLSGFGTSSAVGGASNFPQMNVIP